jgi:hypothetical protein
MRLGSDVRLPGRSRPCGDEGRLRGERLTSGYAARYATRSRASVQASLTRIVSSAWSRTIQDGREAVTSYDTEEGPKGPGARNVSPV